MSGFVLVAMAIMPVVAVTIAIAIALAILAMPTAAARAHMTGHGFRNLLIGRGVPFIDCQAKILINRSEHQIQLFASFQKAPAAFVVDHIATQLVKFR